MKTAYDEKAAAVRPLFERFDQIEAELAACRQKSAELRQASLALKQEREALQRRYDEITGAKWRWRR